MFSHHKTLRSARQKKRRRNLFRLRVAASVLFFASGIGGLLYLSRSPAITITTVRVEGTETADRELLESSAQNILSEKYLWLFPKRNFFLYPQGALQKSLLDSFKRLETLSMHTPDFKTLVISVTERVPHALWCGTLMDNAAGSESAPCYFVDERGLLFAQAPSFSGDLYFTYYGDVGKGEPIGKRVLPPESFRALGTFLTSLRTLGFEPIALGIDGGDITIRLKKGNVLLISLKEDPGRTLQNLHSFLAGSAASVVSADQTGDSFHSIDLRFGNKIFFKRR